MKVIGIMAVILLLAAAGALIYLKKNRWTQLTRIKSLGVRIGVAALIVLALELSLFNYSTYAFPSGEGTQLTLSEGMTSMVGAGDQGLAVNANEDSSVTWSIEPTDVQDVKVTLRQAGDTPSVGKLTVSAADRNFSTLMSLNTTQALVKGDTDVYVTTSSKGMEQMMLTVNASQNVTITAVSLNAERPLNVNLLRVFLLILAVGAVLAVQAYGIHHEVYRPDSVWQRVIALGAALVCCIAITAIGTAQAQKSSGALMEYDKVAAGKDPYYQMFDAFQKGQTNLDLTVDERLVEAGDKVYDYSYRSQMGMSYEWDRAFYNGKYYCYFGVAPMLLFYYPVYFITGMVPTTGLTCTFFSILFVIFGFILVFRIARSIVKNANYLLTLLTAAVLPLMSGIYILMSYGDFYNLPKLCGLAFLMLLYYLTIAGYEKPRWYIFLLCGVCVGILLASRPNVLIMALSLAPLYIGVLANRGITLKVKMICLAAFMLPILLCGALVMLYNSARFGSPLEFGAKYQLTVNNIAMNNISLGFLGMAFYRYFLQPADFRAEFPYYIPQYKEFGSLTRYFYITTAFGVMSLPFNWGLLAYPAVRKRSELRPAFKWTLALSVGMGVIVALLDYALAGVTISYVCDIAAMIALSAIAIVLLAEKCARKTGAHRIVYLAAILLTAATFAACIALVLGTEPLFIKNYMPETYMGIASLFAV